MQDATDSANASDDSFSLRACLGSSWVVVRDYWLPLSFAAFLRELLANCVVIAVFAMFIDWRGWNVVIALCSRFVAWSILQAGYLSFCLQVTGKSVIDWRSFFAGLARGPHFLLANVLWLWSVIVGLLLLLLPGLFLAARFAVFGPALVDERLNALAALRASNQMMKEHMKIAAPLLVLYAISYYCIAWIVEPLFFVAICILYQKCKAKEVAA